MKVTVELIAIELPQFGSAKSRDLDLKAGANVADALSGLGVDGDPALLAMVNGEAVPRDQWPETPLSADDTISLFGRLKVGGRVGYSDQPRCTFLPVHRAGLFQLK